MRIKLEFGIGLAGCAGALLLLATLLLSVGLMPAVAAAEAGDGTPSRVSAVDPSVIESLSDMTRHLDDVVIRPPDDAPPGANLMLGGTNEPTIVVNPTNPLNIAYASLRSLRVSIDGGISFEPAVNSQVPATHGRCGDPSVAFDSQGRLFWTYLGCARDSLGNRIGIDIFIARCNPNTGAILGGYPVNITASAGVGMPGSAGNWHDKEWLAADFYPGSSFTDRLYVTWSDLTVSGASVIRTTFSTDQGGTWSAPVALSAGGEGFVWPCHNTVAPNGDVYVAYHDQTSFAGGPPSAPDGVSGRVFVCRSSNGGVSFPQKHPAFGPGQADITFNRQAAPNPIPGTQFWLQGSAQPFIMADPNTPGRIYVVACDDPDNAHGAGDDANVYLMTSTDNGVNWNGPVRIDDGPGTEFQVMPTASIDANTGCMVVHYYDNRNGATNGAGRFLLDVFAQSSSDGGATWSPSIQLNDNPFDPDPGAPCRFGPLANCGDPDPVVTSRIGEYNGVAVANGLGFAVWCGNTFTAGGVPVGQQSIFDRFAFDTQPPYISCPGDITVECSQTGGVPYSEIAAQLVAGAADDCDSNVDITDDAPALFPLGVTAVTFVATDDAGNSSSCQTLVEVIDTTPPTIACPADATVECSGFCGTPSTDPQLVPFFAGVSASDICCLVSVTDDRPACFPFGTTTVTFTAADCVNLTSSCQATVTVDDTTPPVIVCPEDITVACNGPGGTYADDPQLDPFFAGVSATDVCDPSPVITDDAPAFFPVGTTPVEFTATDHYNNQSSCIANVRVVDMGIDVWLDSLLVNPGDNVFVPIYIQDVTGWGLMGFETQICWCDVPAGLLQYEYCVPGDVMTSSGWAAPICNPCAPNCINVAGAGAAPLAGGGVLFYLKFHVSANAKPCMCCDLEFEFINLYDPEVPLYVCWQNGSVCVDWCDIEGYVKYWKCCQDECGEWYLAQPLAGVNVDLWDCESVVESQNTDADGHYAFECVDPLTPVCPSYCVSVESCGLLEECVTAYDASLILQYVVCLDDLMDCPFLCGGAPVYPQMVAADANCSGQVTAYDASLVLQYVVGLIDLFPCYTQWTFYPQPDCNACVLTCPGQVDFIGVRRGDVSGCPECPPLPAPFAASPARIKLGRATEYPDRVEIPVVVKDAREIQSIEMDMAYDARNYSVLSVVPTGLATGFMSFYNAVSGNLFIAMAGQGGFDGQGQVARVTLEKIGSGLPSPRERIKIVDALFNEGTPEALIEGGRGGDVLARFALGPISPNPFTGGTTVYFNVPSSSHVTIGIYNVNGQLVTTLMDHTVSTGRQSVAWDGRDSTGDRVGRGVYFCRMVTGSFTATAKVVLLQ